LAKDKCIFDPSLSELIESAKSAGLEPTATEDQVRFPRRPFVRSGYIVLEKKLPKTSDRRSGKISKKTFCQIRIYRIRKNYQNKNS